MADAIDAAHLRVAVLVSGRGSNLQSLIKARDAGMPVDLVGVFSDRSDAAALRHASTAGIAAMCLQPAAFVDEARYQRALFATVAASRPRLIVCAGFMRIIRAELIAASAPMINIHPSLLPLHRGLHTHRRALEAGDALHGASVHRVTAELDGGPVLAQASMRIEEEDDAASLAARLLPLEHHLLVACVGAIASGEVVLTANEGMRFRDTEIVRPLRFDPRGNSLSLG